MADEKMMERMQSVERLLQLFKLERHVYLIINTLSLVLLLGSAVFLIVRAQASAESLTLIFGSSGLLAYTQARLLRMWDQAVNLVILAEKTKEDSK